MFKEEAPNTFVYCRVNAYVLLLSKFNIQFVNLSYLESQRIFASQQAFLLLEATLLSLSRLEAELWAHLLVARTNLELDIMSYNALKSQYYTVLNRSTDMVK